MDGVRLNKFIAEAGVASRRKADELILQGRVKVNGETVSEPGVRLKAGVLVEVDGKAVAPERKKVYIMLHKPARYISSVKDQFSRKTVLDLIKGVRERVYPVGRLDYDTSGLLLLTNDGDFAYRMTHPKHEVDKVYLAVVAGVPDEKDMEAFKNGIVIDGLLTSPARLKVVRAEKDHSLVKITLREGRNRQVRKMCQAIGHPAISLKRIGIGRLRLGNLKEGKWRNLTREELRMLGL